MKVYPECYECLRRLAENTAELASDDRKIIDEARKAALKVLQETFSPDVVSVEVATKIHDIIKDVSDNADPYRCMKDREIELARQLFNRIKPFYMDGFLDILKLAVIGNSMDFFRSLETINKNDFEHNKVEFVLDDSALFLEKLQKARKVLYLGDNSGEAYFDMPLYKWMSRYAEVSYVVKARPVQNDVTREELRIAGLEKEFDSVIDTGTATPGIVMSQASAEFRDSYYAADLVLAKGMGYYETLSELAHKDRVFYCFKAKCNPVATSLKVPLDSYVAGFL